MVNERNDASFEERVIAWDESQQHELEQLLAERCNTRYNVYGVEIEDEEEPMNDNDEVVIPVSTANDQGDAPAVAVANTPLSEYLATPPEEREPIQLAPRKRTKRPELLDREPDPVGPFTLVQPEVAAEPVAPVMGKQRKFLGLIPY